MQQYRKAIGLVVAVICVSSCKNHDAKERSESLQLIYKIASPKGNMVAYVYDIFGKRKRGTRNISVLESEEFPERKGNVASFALDEKAKNEIEIPKIKWKSGNIIEINDFPKSATIRYKDNVAGIKVIIK